jgi:hypothetical protein
MRHIILHFNCKTNYAYCVNCIMPYIYFLKTAYILHLATLKPLLNNCLWRFLLDNHLFFGIIRLTVKMSYSGDKYYGRLWRSKRADTQSKRHIKHSSAGSYRRIVSGRRVFRPSRHAAGQIRDASKGPAGWDGGFKSSGIVRLFPRFVLPDTARLRPARISRPYAASARPKTRSQTDRRDNGLYWTLQSGSPCHWFCRAGYPVKAAFRPVCTPPQYRTGIAATAKKRALKLPEQEECFHLCIKRYEKMRGMILEGKDYCCQGWGLALIVHRGFKAWIYTFSKIESYQQQPPEPIVCTTKLSIPETIQGKMIMTISEMVLSTLQGVAS